MEMVKKSYSLGEKFLKTVGDSSLYPPLNGYSPFIQGSEYNISKYYDKWYDGRIEFNLFIYIKDGFSQVWLSENVLKKGAEIVFKEYLDDPNSLWKRINYMNKNIKKIDKIYSSYTYDKIEHTNFEDLLNLIIKIRDLIWDANAAVMFSAFFDKSVCKQWIKEEGFNLSEDDLNAIWEKGVHPAFESFDKAQFADFLRIFQKKSWLEVVEHCQYFLTDYHSAKNLKDIDSFLKEKFSEFVKNPKICSSALNKEIEEIKLTEKEHLSWSDGLNANERKIADFLQLVMKIRDRRKNFFAKGLTIIYRIAERLFREEGVDRDLIPYYTVRELLKGRKYLHLSSTKKDLSERKRGFEWLIPYNSLPEKETCDIEKDRKLINDYYLKSHQTEANLLRGQSASKGIVRGKVRIVLNVNSKSKFENGEILVAGMTRPEYVSLMKKSAGIITDEGGITCHAAIVSRELKKPCVIGTKFATKFLKDEDYVELDANEGIVKILKRKNDC